MFVPGTVLGRPGILAIAAVEFLTSICFSVFGRALTRFCSGFETVNPIVVKGEDAADAPAAGSPLRYDKALRVRL